MSTPETDLTLEIVQEIPLELSITEEIGITIELGESGPAGSDAENGIPAGGDTGQVLTKLSDDDFDSDWVELPEPAITVASVFGRDGVVIAEDGDYNEQQVAILDPSVYEDLTDGTVTGVNVQALFVSLITAFSTTISGIFTILTDINSWAFNKLSDDSDDITEGATKKFVSSAQKTLIDAAVQPGDAANQGDLYTRSGADAAGLSRAALAADAAFTNAYDPIGAAAAIVENAIVDGVLGKAPSQNAVYDALQAVYTAIALRQLTSEKNQANGYAGLGADGKLLSAQLPALAITDTFVVNSQAAMLALSTAETGDVAVRTDVSKSFILKGTTYSTLADWQELLTPTDLVSSVNGRTGVVTGLAEAADLLAHTANVSNPHSVTKTQVGLSAVTNVQQQPIDQDLTDIAAIAPANDDIIQRKAGSWINRTMAQLKADLGLTKTDVGLSNVPNVDATDRANHTGTQLASTISNFAATVASYVGSTLQAWSANLDAWALKTAPSGTVLGTTDSQTVTNKRITRRTVTVTQSATPSLATDTGDIFKITGLAQAITSVSVTGAPVDGDMMIVEITDSGSPRAIAWGGSFETSTVALPTTTVASTLLQVGFKWNAATTKWRCIASA
jgi:hypothetical protein